MRNLLLLFGLVLFNLPVFAQRAVVRPSAQGLSEAYLFDTLQAARVLFKSGSQLHAYLNYYRVSEEMIFHQDGKVLALDMPGIDTIYLGAKKFVPLDQAFVEVQATPVGTLYIRHRFKFINRGKPAAYGGYTETAAVSNLSHITILDQHMPLSVKSGQKLEDVTLFWIRRGRQFFDLSSPQKFIEAFPEQEAVIRRFSAAHRMNQFDLPKALELLMLLQQRGG